MKKLIFIILISLTNIPLLQAEVRKNIFLSYSEYNNLNLKAKDYYFKSIQKEFFQFEKISNTGATFVSNDTYNNSLSTLFFPLAFADDTTATEMCIIGGQSVPRIQNKCSTRKNPCKDASPEKYPDGSFQCGEIFNSVCVSRKPIKSLSARCFEAAQNSDTPPTAAEYEKITSRANELYQKVCGTENTNQSSIGCQKLSKKINELNIKAKSMDSGQQVSKGVVAKDEKNASSSEDNTDCLQIVSLTLEGSEQIKENSPIRENGLHQEATGFVDSLSRFANSTNYWIEPTDQPAQPNCQTTSKNQHVSKTSSDYVKELIVQVKKFSAAGISCNDLNLQEKIKNYFLNSTSTQKNEAGLVYKNSSSRLLPNDSEQLCAQNLGGSSFIRIPITQNKNLSELASPFLKKVQDLAKQCKQNKPSIQISVFANSGNTTQDECSIRFMNKTISAEEFYKSIYKPVRKSNLPITLNLNQYSTCFQKKLVSLESDEKDKTSLTGPSCVLVLSSPDEPGHGINELFGPSPTIKYEQFLSKLQNPLAARVCAMSVEVLENSNNSLLNDYKKIIDELSSKNIFRGEKSLFETCETTYKEIKNESKKIKDNLKEILHSDQHYLNVKEKKFALDCLKQLSQKKNSDAPENDNQTIFGLLPQIKNSPTAEKPYSYLQLLTISKNIPKDCNQDLSLYKKNMFAKKSAPAGEPPPSNPPSNSPPPSQSKQ